MSLKDREVTLVPDPYWPDRFEEEQSLIQQAASDGLLGVYHVGSTAIPDVPGKPALDVIAVFEDESSMESAADVLIEEHGFERPEEATIVIRWEEESAVFVKLHTRDDEKVRAQLAFRDYLLDHPDAREDYAEIKEQAAEAHEDDLEAYTKMKGEFVSSTLESAKEAGYYDELPAFA